MARWLEPLGLAYIQVPVDDPMLKVMFRHGETYTTIEGISPRGGQHACVALNGRLIWDPHPEDQTGRGLVKAEVYGLLCARMVR